MGWKWLCEETGPCRGGFTHRAWPLGMEAGGQGGPESLHMWLKAQGRLQGLPRGDAVSWQRCLKRG